MKVNHLFVSSFVALLLFFNHLTLGQSECEELHGLYVATDYWGNTTEEDKLLEFAKNNGINYLILYNYNLNNPDVLGAFIKKAKTEYGMKEVGAILVISDQLAALANYNNSRPVDERFDVFNFEMEFWNHDSPSLGYCNYISPQACTRENFFDFFIEEITKVENTTEALGIDSELYIGWPTEEEAVALANVVDRVLLHFYRTTDVNIINYGIDRLEHLSGANKTVKVLPIFSSEGTNNTADLPFMGDWLKSNPVDEAFESWKTQYDALSDPWKSNLEIHGSSWFVYERFIENHSNHIITNPSEQYVVSGASATFSVESSATQKKYYWYKDYKCLEDGGGISGSRTATLTINNISALDGAQYSCRVVSYDTDNPGQFMSIQAPLHIIEEQQPFANMITPIPGIIEFEEYDLGGQSVSYNELNQVRESENKTFRGGDGVDIEDCSEGGYNLGYCEPTEWLEYSVQSLTTATYSVTLRAATNTSGKCHLEIDGVDVTGTIDISNTGGWQEWDNITANSFQIAEGNHIIRLVMDEGSANYNFMTLDLITGQSVFSTNEVIHIFPNPSQSGVFYMNKSLSGQIINSTGQIIDSFKQADIISLQNYSEGMYFLLIDGVAHRLNYIH